MVLDDSHSRLRSPNQIDQSLNSKHRSTRQFSDSQSPPPSEHNCSSHRRSHHDHSTKSRHRSRSRSRSRDLKHREYKPRSDRESHYRSSHHRSRSRSPRKEKSRRSRSRSPRRKDLRRDSRSRSRSLVRKSRAPLPSQGDSYAREKDPDAPIKQQPNWGLSGLLAKEANTISGTNIVLKYHEPADARLASQDWRLFIFKGSEEVSKPIPLTERSCWLLGREDRVADLPVMHGSVSKQHCVIQFRHVAGDDGRKTVKPYVIDLESSNGTTLNGERIPAGRYVQIRSGDIMKIASSEREYVFLLAPKD